MRWLVVVGLMACGGDPEPSGPCVDEQRAQDFAAGLAGEGALSATLVRADPERPSVGENVWHVDLEGDFAGCALSVEPFMPDHGHGTIEPATIQAGDEASHELFMDLNMGGFWTVEVAADCGGDVTSAVFSVCAET